MNVQGAADGQDQEWEAVVAEPDGDDNAVAQNLAPENRAVPQPGGPPAAAAAAIPEAAAPRVYQVPERHDSVYDLCPRDPSRMELTEQERQWALAMKELVESDPELDNLADFEYAQLAIVDHDDVEQALERVRHFQIFREEYNMADTVEEAKRTCHGFVRLQPLTVLSLCYHKEEGNYVMVADIARCYEKNLKTEEDHRTLIGFAYFCGHVMTPDFAAIRRGAYFVLETMDYDWRNLSIKTRRRMWTEAWALYPFQIQQMKYFHTGLFASLAASLMRKFVPEEIYSKIQVGCQFAGRLDTFYAVPTREIANQRLLERMDACLERRYENIQNFRL